MCGICGRLNLKAGHKVSTEELKRMTNVIHYRGPDDEGFYLDGEFGMGHRRLSIIDLSSGHQPLANEDKTIWVTLNGEIYNYLELKDELVKKGHKFSSKSDTEVIVHLYEEDQEEFVHKLRGMFAIAIWDQNNKTLTLIRDRLGKKPVFYSYVPDQYLIYGSEIKSILQARELKREIDFEAIDHYLSYFYIPGEMSIFKSIKKLPAGHMLKCTRDTIQVKEYWDLKFRHEDNKPESYYEQKFLEHLTESVKIRLRSDVPLGAFLSGGIDSSLIVMLMSQLLNRPVETSTIGFSEKIFDEIPYARIVAEKYRCNHFEQVVNADLQIREMVTSLIKYFDEPFADSSAIPTFFVCKNTRRKVIVALSGDGGDEAMAGYTRYFIDSLEHKLRSYTNFLKPSMIAGIVDLLPKRIKGYNSLKNLSFPSDEAAVRKHYYGAFTPELKERLYTNDFKNETSEFDDSKIFRDYYNKNNATNHLDKLIYLDMKTYLVDDILVKVDRMSMANSLEVRSPLLDHKLWGISRYYSSIFKIKRKNHKIFNKKTFEEILSSEFYNQKKARL